MTGRRQIEAGYSYIVDFAYSPDDMSKTAQAYILCGYKPLGGVCVMDYVRFDGIKSGIVCYQAFYKEPAPKFRDIALVFAIGLAIGTIPIILGYGMFWIHKALS